MAGTKPRKIIEMLEPCKKGSHTFIVSTWETSASRKKATFMKCQHCLMPIELNEMSQDWVVNEQWLSEKTNSKAE